jgi:glutathione synthase/RimK-type ligase-like ATP-grasp enzyme
VIVVWGALDDPPVVRVLDALDGHGVDAVHLDDRQLGVLSYDVQLGSTPQGWFEIDGRRVELDAIEGLYLRPGEQNGVASSTSAMLLAVAGTLPVPVVNRPTAGRSNLSKPFQLSLIASVGIATPDTLVTSDITAARAFLARHGRIVYKSISGQRSIVSAIDAAEPDRLDAIGHGPAQLQQWIDGLDVRVHVVDDRWFATSVVSSATDYRYASDEYSPVELAPIDIPTSLGEQLVLLSRRMGLLVSGIDLRHTVDGQWFCFEVNPSPGFTYYEDHTGQPIGSSIATLLRSRHPNPPLPLT